MKKILIIIVTLFSFLLLNTNIVHANGNCNLWGTIIKNWRSIRAFSSQISDDCKLITKVRFCIDWKLSWNNDYKYTTCNDYNPLLQVDNVNIWNPSDSNKIENKLLNKLRTEEDITVWKKWEASILSLLLTIAKDVKAILYILSGLFFLILVIKLIFSSNTEEEVWKFKKWIIWISLWIVVMQMSFFVINILYAKDIWWDLAYSASKNLINPIIKFLETSASFLFLLIAIYAFYTIITANWEEEKVKTWKMSIFYWLIWFLVIKLAKDLVSATYWKVNCEKSTFLNIFTINWNNCSSSNDLSWVNDIIINIINWMNGFIWIVVVIMIIYAGAQVIFWAWNDDNLSKAKKSILYIIIWLIILTLNYFILTFFFLPEVTI